MTKPKYCIQVFHEKEFDYGNLRWYETNQKFLKELNRLNKKYGHENDFVLEE